MGKSISLQLLFSHVEYPLRVIPTNASFYQSINFRESQEMEREMYMKCFLFCLFFFLHLSFSAFIYKSLPCFNPFGLPARLGVDGKRFGVKYFKRNKKITISSITFYSSKTTKEINSKYFRECAGRKPRKMIFKYSC